MGNALVVGNWRAGLSDVAEKWLKGVEEHREKGFRLLGDVEFGAQLIDLLDSYDEFVGMVDEEPESEEIPKKRGRGASASPPTAKES